jgi:NAD(P)-dependent dehydrogenase (short-subunit alcohol dehydrogenase family)
MTLADKVAVVTGGTSGIGFETALGLAAKGASVFLVGRDPAKGAAACASIRERVPAALVHMVAGDLSSLAGVKAIASQITARQEALHILVNNFGGPVMQLGTSADGIELNWARNFATPFLLTGRLMPLLRAAGHARIVNVSTGIAARELTLDDLEGRGTFKPFRAYGESKLAVLAFTNGLAAKLAGRGVTANALHPGVAWTAGFNSGFPEWARFIGPMVRPFLKTAEQAAATSIFLASDPSLVEITGRFFQDCHEAEPRGLSKDAVAQLRVWRLGEQLTGEPFSD